MFAMSGDGTDNVDIPVVFLFSQDAWNLLQALAQNPAMLVTLGDTLTGKKKTRHILYIHSASNKNRLSKSFQ